MYNPSAKKVANVADHQGRTSDTVTRRLRAVSTLCLLAFACQAPMVAQNEQLQTLQSHFERVVRERFDQLFRGIDSVEEWEERKQETSRALHRMLWHERRWPADPPRARVVRRQQRGEYAIENTILETAPGIHATANLYLPRERTKPYPVILYQCGHASKTRFKHHGAWFAARGIAAMIMDNIEMGEIQFTHHGVYAHAWFHWYSRGFSPLAVELLNARRALDYLVEREDIDSERVGATGISGGGMATFFLSAIDDRIKASAPVSGTLSTKGWVEHGLSRAHCDCQYPVNSHGLTYSEIGALTAPRKQLLVNADADRGFPMDSFEEMAEKMREVYRLYGADGALRVAVVPGGHADTETIRLPVYEFFLKEFLGIEDKLESEGPIDAPEDEELECYRDGYPADERLTRIDRELIPVHRFRHIGELKERLQREVFRYFPGDHAALEPTWSGTADVQGRIVRAVRFHSFPDLEVSARFSVPRGSESRPRLPAVLVLDHRKGIPVWGNEQPLEGIRWGKRAVLVVETLDRGSRALEDNLRSFRDDDLLHHLRRQAMVMGMTLDSMRVYEILRSLEFLRSQPEVDPEKVAIVGQGQDGINGLYAAMLDGSVSRVVIGSPPASHRQGPHYLGILRYTDIPETVALMGSKVRLYGEVPPSIRTALERAGLANGVIGDSLIESLR